MGEFSSVDRAGVECIGRQVQGFRRCEDDGFGGEGAAGDLADGLLQHRIVRRDFARCVVKGALPGFP